MSVSAWGAVFDVARELRWWFSAPSPGVSVPALLLGALVLGCCCFVAGASVACVALSTTCRRWLWHCAAGAIQASGITSPGRGELEVQRRFRKYRA